MIRFSAFVAVVGLAAAAPAGAIGLVVADKTVADGGTLSFAAPSTAAASGTWNWSLNTCSGTLRPIGISISPTSQTTTSPANPSTTVSWAAAETTYGLAQYDCLELKVCKSTASITECRSCSNSALCAADTFALNVTPNGSLMSLAPIHDYLWVAGDATDLVIPLAVSHAALAGTPQNNFVLESCPAGACTLPTLPTWATLQQTGTTMQLKLNPPIGTPSGDWRFKVTNLYADDDLEPNNTLGTAQPVGTTTPVALTVSSLDPDFFIFDNRAFLFGSVQATFTGTCAATTQIRIRNTAGTVLATSTNTGTTCPTVSFGTTADVVIEVFSSNGAVSTGTLTVSGATVNSESFTVRLADKNQSRHFLAEDEAVNNNAVTAPTVDIFGGPILAAISPAADVDFYPFDVNATFEMSFITQGADTLCPGDTQLTLSRRNGDGSLTQLFTNDDIPGSACAAITDVTLPPATYVLQVNESGNNGIVNDYMIMATGVTPQVSDSTQASPANESAIRFASDRAAMSQFDSGDFYLWNGVGVGDLLMGRVTGPNGVCGADFDIELFVENTNVSACPFYPSGNTRLLFDDDSGTTLCGNLDDDVNAGINNLAQCNSSPQLKYFFKVTQSGIFGRNTVEYVIEMLKDPLPRAPVMNNSLITSPPTMTYGTCTGELAINMESLTDVGSGPANLVGAFDLLGSSAVTCPPNLLDAMGNCRAGSSTSFISEGRLVATNNPRFRFEDMIYHYAAQPSDLSGASFVERVQLNAQSIDGNLNARETSVFENGATDPPSVLSVTTNVGGNHLIYPIPSDCEEAYCTPNTCGISSTNVFPQPTTSDGSCGATRCDPSAVFDEGERVRFALKRFNQLSTTTVALSACSSFSAATCGLAPPTGMTYDAATDVLLWDIPFTQVASGTADFFFRVSATGTRGEAAANMLFKITVANATPPAAGADLRVVGTRRLTPSVVHNGLVVHKVGASRAHHPGEDIVVDGKGNVANGLGVGSTFEVDIVNRGTVAADATTVDFFLVDGETSSVDNTTAFPLPTTPRQSLPVAALAAGAAPISLQFSIGEDEEAGISPVPSFPPLPRAVYFRVNTAAGEAAGNVANNLAGPFPLVNEAGGFAGSMAIVIPSLTGTISSVTPAVPKSGELVTVKVQAFTAVHTPAGVPVRFYDDLASAPDNLTPASQELAFPPGAVDGVVYTFTHTFTAQKPNRASDALSLRAFLDPTDLLDEANETDNQLPSAGAARTLVIGNSAPTITSTVPAAQLTRSEDQTFSYTVVVNDADDVDIDRMTIALLGGAPARLAPTGNVVVSGAFPNRSAQRTFTWPNITDAEAAAGSASFTFRACDGDPITPTCVDQVVNLALTRIDDQPVFGAVASPIAINEDQATTSLLPSGLRVSASDEEGAALSFSVQTQPLGGGMTLQAVGGNPNAVDVIWTPGDAVVGNGRTATLRVTDGTSTPQNLILTFNVANVNDPPVIAVLGTQLATEEQAFSSSIAVGDADLDVSTGIAQTITCGKVSGPAWITVTATPTAGPRLCLFGGTPNNADTSTVSSPSTLVLSATDSSGAGNAVATRAISFVVADVNDAPAFVGAPSNGAIVSVAQGVDVNLDFNVVDVDFSSPAALESLTVSKAAGPAALVVTPGARSGDTTPVHVAWVPAAADVGDHSVTVRANDGVDLDRTFTIRVTNVNDAPVLAAIGAQTLSEGSTFSLATPATDGDLGVVGVTENLTYSVSGGPPGLVILEVNETTGNVQIGNPAPIALDDVHVGVFNVTVTVTDLLGATNSKNFTLTVTNVEENPTLTVANDTATEDVLKTKSIVGADPDTGATLTYTLRAPVPAGATLTPAGAFSWTPSNAQVGANTILLRATDNTARFVDTSFVITVANVNDAPTFTSTPVTTATEDVAYSYNVVTLDIDAGSTVTLTAPTKPAFLTLTGNLLSGTPANNAVGVHNVVLVANDGITTTQQSFTITVANVNDAPVISTINGVVPAATPLDVNVAENGVATLNVVAVDVDAGDTKTFSFEADPAFADATMNPTTGVLTINTTFDEAGDHLVTVTVTDAVGAFDEEFAVVHVSNVDRAPVFTSALVASPRNEDAALVHTAAANDPDGTAVTFTVVRPPSPVGLSINASTGVVSFTPTQANVGTITITLRATSNGLSTDQTSTVVITNVDDQPTFTSTPPATPHNEGAVFSYVAAAVDEDGDALVFAAPTKPSWLAFNAGTRTLSGTPDDADVGVHNVVLSVSDGSGPVVTQSFSITVVNVNDAPVFIAPTPSGTLNVAEGATLTFDLEASDPDGPSQTFSISGLPAGASLNSSTGAFTWTPNFTDGPSTRSLTLEVNDGAAPLVTRALSINVSNTDRAPVVTAPATRTVAEGVNLSFAVTAADADGDSITSLTMTSGPPGATFVGGTFSFTPSFTQAGTVTATFQAQNALTSTPVTTTITVTNVPQPPALGAPDSTSATQGVAFVARLTAIDPDVPTDTLTFSKVSGPATMTVTKEGTSVARLNWTPAANEVPSQAVTIRVSDGTSTNDQSFVVNVANVADDPSFTSAPVTAATQGSAYSYTATVTDPDLVVGDTLTITATTKPAWLTLTGSTLSGTPGNGDVGNNNVTLRVTDSTGRFATQSFVVVVANINDAPVLAAIGPQTVPEGQILSFVINGSDVDVGQTLTFSASGLPAGATFTAATRTFRWATNFGDAGLFNVTFTVTDNGAPVLNDSEVVSIAVGDVNRAPDIVPIADVSVAENSLLTINVSSSDADFDVVTLTAAGDVAADPFARGATFTPAGLNGTFSWTPGFNDAGVYLVTFTASDPDGAVDTELVAITVNNTNRAPTFTAPTPAGPNVAGAENALLTFTVQGTDADGQTVSYSATGLPAGAAINAASGVFTFTPSFTQAGTFNIVVSASDGALSVTRNLALVIANTDRAPTLSGVPATATVAEGGSLTFTAVGADADGDAVTLSQVGSLARSSFVAGTGVFTFTPDFTDAGTKTVTLRASANGANTDVTTTITVTNVNQAPTLGAPTATAATQGTLFQATLTAADVDLAAPGDTLSFSKIAGPSSMTVTKTASTTGRLDWTPSAAEVNPPTTSVTIRVTDAAGLFADRTFSVSVANINDAPSLAQPANGTVAQNATFTTTLSATDPDLAAGLADTLTFSLTTAPAGMTVNASSGALSFPTNNTLVGVHNVTARVVDTAGASATASFTVTVTNVNDTPLITSSAPTTATQGTLYSTTVTATDGDIPVPGDTLTFSAPTKPAWLSFNATTRVLSGTPADADVGSANVVVRATDAAGAFDERAFTIVVANINDAPVLAAIGPQSTAENQLLTFVVNASDVDEGDTLAFTTGALPTGATFNATTRTFSWTPAFDQAGSVTVRFTVTDNGVPAANDFEDVVVTVGNTDRAPTLTAIGNKTVAENATLNFTVAGADLDGDALTFSATGATAIAAGATFNTSTRVFNWATDFADAGTYSITFTVSDGTLSANETITVTVTDVNRAPAFTSTPTLTTAEDAAFSYDANASDADGDTVSFSLVTAPAGMTIVAGTGVVSWVPQNADVGANAVTVRVVDGRGGSVDQSFTLTVTNTNDAPTFTSTPVVVATEAVAYAYTAVAVDVDVGAVLTFSAPTLPAFLAFNPSTRVLSGTPSQAQVGSHNVVLRVSDGTVNVDQAFTVVVAAVNDPPVFVAPTPSGTLTVNEGQTLGFTAAGSDPENTPLTFALTGLPVGATFNTTTGVFNWPTNFTDASTRTVTLTVSDGALQATRNLTLTVVNVDRAPVVNAPATATVAEGQTLSLTITASDPDGDAVVLTMPSAPSGATFNASTGAFSFSPNFDSPRTASARFVATAGGLTGEVITAIDITDVNRAPVVTSAPPATATEDVPLTYAVIANDADGDALTFQLLVGVANASLSATGVLTWTPTGAQAGNRDFVVRIRDGRGATVDHAFTVVVAAVNDAPVITSTPLLTATEDVLYTHRITATDEDGDALTFSLTTAPAGMVINATGNITFTPNNAQVGNQNVVVRVSDGTAAFTQSFTVVVANTNDVPIFAANPAPATAVAEDALFTFTPAVSDVDVGDSVTLTLVQAPLGMTLSAGTLSYRPVNADVGPQSVRLRATDRTGAFTDLAFTLTVVNTNDAPVLVTPPISTTVAEGATFAAVIAANDVDAGDILLFSLVGAPASASIDAVTGLLTFAPDDADVGVRSFSVRVSDQAGAQATLAASFTVTAVNDAPVLAPIGNLQIGLGATLTVTLAATDVDNAGLVFSFVADPTNARMSLAGNVFTFSPTVNDAGATTVTFTVSDGTLTDTETVTVVAGDGGLPPSITLPADASVNEGASLTANISARSQSGAVVPVSTTNLPPGATFNTATGAFAWTPSFNDAGVFGVTFAASDGSGTTRRTWNITVINVNRPPLASSPSTDALEDTAYASSIVASDPDGDALTFTVRSGPVGLTVDGAGVVRFAPDFDDVGANAVAIDVADGKGGVFVLSFTIVVAFVDVDRDLLPDTWETEFGTDLSRNDAGEDPDGDGLTNRAEFLANKDPFVSNAPPPPTLLSPDAGGRVDTAQPNLSWVAVADPDGDVVTYHVVVAHAADVTDIAFEDDVDGTDVDVGAVLDENADYIWFVRAGDGVVNVNVDGPSTSLRRGFTVDATNEAPFAPTLVAPSDGGTVGVATPTLIANDGGDPDGDDVRFVFRVVDADTGAIVSQSLPLAPDANGAVVFVVDAVLADGQRLTWTVEPIDIRGLAGELSSEASFAVNLFNIAPPTPVITSPEDDEVLDDASVVVRLAGVIDPEGSEVLYRIELSPRAGFPPDVTTNFDGLRENVSGEVVAPVGNLDDGEWFVRARATDGITESGVATVRFVVDAVNAPPATPTLVAPADNALVSIVNGGVDVSALVAVDPEGEDVTHHFQLFSDDGATLLEEVDGEIDVGTVSARFLTPVGGDRHQWSVVAEDERGGRSVASERRSFRVATSNDRPGAPQLLSPTEGEIVTTARPLLRVGEADDVDGDTLVYEVTVAQGGRTAAVIGGLRTTGGVVLVEVPVALADGEVQWSAVAKDVIGAGPAATATFVVDTVAEGEGEEGEGEEGEGEEGEGEAGEGEGEEGEEGEGEGGAPVVVTIDPPHPPVACGCAGSNDFGSAVGVGVFGGLLLLRRRRRVA